MNYSTSQINKAGDRIRRSLRNGMGPSTEDIAVVEAFRARHIPGLLEIQAILEHTRVTLEKTLLEGYEDLEEDFFQIAARPKTTPAIVQKLGRSTTRLSRMQDVAGGRIVVPLLWMQDAVASGVLDLLSGRSPEVKDTRAEGDQLGYRAVHVV